LISYDPELNTVDIRTNFQLPSGTTHFLILRHFLIELRLVKYPEAANWKNHVQGHLAMTNTCLNVYKTKYARKYLQDK